MFLRKIFIIANDINRLPSSELHLPQVQGKIDGINGISHVLERAQQQLISRGVKPERFSTPTDLSTNYDWIGLQTEPSPLRPSGLVNAWHSHPGVQCTPNAGLSEVPNNLVSADTLANKCTVILQGTIKPEIGLKAKAGHFDDMVEAINCCNSIMQHKKTNLLTTHADVSPADFSAFPVQNNIVTTFKWMTGASDGVHGDATFELGDEVSRGLFYTRDPAEVLGIGNNYVSPETLLSNMVTSESVDALLSLVTYIGPSL